MANSMVFLPIRTSTLTALISKIANSGMSPDEMIEKILDGPAMHEVPKAASHSVAYEPASIKKYEILIFGQRFPASTLQQVLTILLGTFSDLDPNFCNILSRKRTHARNYIARDRADIHLNSPHLKSESFEFRPGWWTSTNNSKQQVIGIIKASCEVLGLEFESDVVFR